MPHSRLHSSVLLLQPRTQAPDFLHLPFLPLSAPFANCDTLFLSQFWGAAHGRSLFSASFRPSIALNFFSRLDHEIYYLVNTAGGLRVQPSLLFSFQGAFGAGSLGSSAEFIAFCSFRQEDVALSY